MVTMADSDGQDQNIQFYFEEGVRVFMRKSYTVTLSGNSVTVTTQHTAHSTHKTKIRYYRTGTYVQYDKILGNLHNKQVDDTFDPSSHLPHTYSFIIWLCWPLLLQSISFRDSVLTF